MDTKLRLGDIVADVVLKDIKNVHLSVYPPNGHVRISAPSGMNLDNIRAYAVTRLDWIKAQQVKLQSQKRITPREYVSGESHYLGGRRYLLSVREVDAPPSVTTTATRIRLQVRNGSSRKRRQELMESWLRTSLKSSVPPIIKKWEPRLGVKVKQFHVRRMKTKWGSCTHQRKAILLNTELAKKPIECLEYIVVHEMVHLLEPTHNARFVALMNKHMPKWKYYRDELNSLPVRHEDWKY